MPRAQAAEHRRPDAGLFAVVFAFSGAHELAAIGRLGYVEGIEYVGGTLELIHMPEGRILKSGNSYTYEYLLGDHLGNLRAGFAGSATGTATFGMDYYPFGLQLNHMVQQPSPENHYLYQPVG